MCWSTTQQVSTPASTWTQLWTSTFCYWINSPKSDEHCFRLEVFMRIVFFIVFLLLIRSLVSCPAQCITRSWQCQSQSNFLQKFSSVKFFANIKSPETVQRCCRALLLFFCLQSIHLNLLHQAACSMAPVWQLHMLSDHSSINERCVTYLTLQLPLHSPNCNNINDFKKIVATNNVKMYDWHVNHNNKKYCSQN